MDIAPSTWDSSGSDICSDGKLSDLEHADDVLLLSEDSSKVQVFLDRLNHIVWVRFASSNV